MISIPISRGISSSISSLLSSTSSSAPVSSLYFTDDAYANQRYTDDAYQNPYFSFGGDTGISAFDFVGSGQSNMARMVALGSQGAIAAISVANAAYPDKTNTWVNGATSGSGLLKADVDDPLTDPWFYDPPTNTWGPAMANFRAAIAPSVASSARVVKAIFWAQGENFPANNTDYQTYLPFVLNTMRSECGDSPIIIICPIGRRTDTITTNFKYQDIRDIQKVVVAANPSYMFRAPESVDQPYGDQNVHLDDYTVYAQRMMRLALKQYGISYPVVDLNGYDITSVERNGAAVTVYTNVPAPINLVGDQGIFYANDSSNPYGTTIGYTGLTLDNTSNPRRITFTLNSVPAGVNQRFYHIFDRMNGLGANFPNVLHDNTAYALPINAANLAVTNITPPAGSSTLQGLVTQSLAEWEATSGSNMVTTPADGSAQTAYDGTWGGSLVPASGGVPAYQTGLLTLTATTYLKNLGNDRSWTVLMLIANPASWTGSPSILQCGGNNAATKGFTFRYVAGTPGNFRVVTSDGTTAPSTNIAGEFLDISANRSVQLIALSYDAPTKAIKTSTLGSSFTGSATNVGANGSLVTSVQASALFASNLRAVWGGMVAKVLNDAELLSIKNALNTRYGITL